MEVFMRNLPGVVNEDVLKGHLKPVALELGITKFSCWKRVGRRVGNIIFTTTADGEKFFHAHGAIADPNIDNGMFSRAQVGRPRQKARLRLFGMHVYCDRGNRVLDKSLVSSISFQADKEEKQRIWDTNHASKNQNPLLVFEVWDFACGFLAYHKKLCCFGKDISWPQRQAPAYLPSNQSPTIKFAKSNVILKLIDGLRVEIAFNSINELVIGHKTSTFIFILSEIPKFYVDANAPGSHIQRRRLESIDDHHKCVVGTSLVYRVEVNSADFTTMRLQLEARPFLSNIITRCDIPFLPTGDLKFPPMDKALSAFQKRLGAEAKEVSFGVLFQLQALAWNGFLHPTTVTEVLNILKSREGTPRAISAASIWRAQGEIQFPGPHVDSCELDADGIVELLDVTEKGEQLGTSLELDSGQESQNLTWIYKARITPTHVLLFGPEQEAGNRVLRKFPDHTDYFLRVQLSEEDGTDVRFNPKVSNEEIYDRFKEQLLKGISIAGRQYGFFGFSHSSLRSHSAWFMAPFVHEGTLMFYDNIIPGLGDFKKIRVVAKCAARIGQTFSETPYAIDMKQNGIEYTSISDLKSPDGSRVFSDGVGTMSTEAMLAIWRNLPKTVEPPTVYQIRFGGSKGVISLDSTLRGRVICIRTESMEKFTSKDTGNLEICGMANRPIRLVLNRQNIKILEDMGVSPRWFLKHQHVEIERIQAVTSNVHNTSVFMTQQSIGDSIEFPKFLKRLNRLGIDYRTDRLLCGIVESVVLQELRLLKHKARIPVPDGITLYGVIDETGFLQEGEIYVTFGSSDGRFGNPPGDNKRLLVTRSPALHPGDIQIAVNKVPPQGHPLSELRNCIVFNYKGDRDIPSMLSGGDLDGDMYHVIWDPELAFDRLTTYEPADYSPQPPREIGRNVEKADMAHFFVDFMKTDQLGLISVKHMILADQQEEGTVHVNCKVLAELASTAVDFSKTGIPADVGKLREIKTSFARPDFLAAAPPVEFVDFATLRFQDEAPIPENDEDEDNGAQHRYYESPKVLGQLFRAVKEEKIWHSSVQTMVKRDSTQLWQKLETRVHHESARHGLKWKHRKQEAQGICGMYENSIRSTMRSKAEHPHKPLTEIEVFIGQVFNKKGAQTRRQRDCSEKLRTAFDRDSGMVWKIIRQLPNIDDGSVAGSVMSGNVPTEKRVLELALACFHVALENDRVKAGNKRSQDLKVESFKVLAGNAFLKELEMYQKAEDIRIESEMMFVGHGLGRGRPLRTAMGGRKQQAFRATGAPTPSIASVTHSLGGLRLIPSQVDPVRANLG